MHADERKWRGGGLGWAWSSRCEGFCDAVEGAGTDSPCACGRRSGLIRWRACQVRWVWWGFHPSPQPPPARGGGEFFFLAPSRTLPSPFLHVAWPGPGFPGGRLAAGRNGEILPFSGIFRYADRHQNEPGLYERDKEPLRWSGNFATAKLANSESPMPRNTREET
jgi:hypothetical protein